MPLGRRRGWPPPLTKTSGAKVAAAATASASLVLKLWYETSI
jgi:hypothetical protein